MKVLFLARWYPGSDHPYEGLFVREHARAARAAGADVAVLHIPEIRRPDRGLWKIVEESDEELTAGIPTFHVLSREVRVPGSRRLTFWLSFGLNVWSVLLAVRKLRSRGFKPDIVHGNIFHSIAIGVIVGRLYRLPLVGTEHNSAFPLGYIRGGSLKRARWAFRNCACVMPVSESLKRAMVDCGVKARFQVVPNAVDVSLFHPAESPTGPGGPAAGPRAKRETRVLFVGSLLPTGHKGLPTLLEALRSIKKRRPGLRLDVVGTGPALDDSKRMAQDAGLGEMATFHGALPKPLIADMMRQSDIFTLPSRFETQSCVVIEALASGLPVVATAVGGVPELVTEADGILVPRDDAAALAAALERMASQSAEYDRPAIAGRAAGRFSFDAVGGQLVRIYEAALAERRDKA